MGAFAAFLRRRCRWRRSRRSSSRPAPRFVNKNDPDSRAWKGGSISRFIPSSSSAIGCANDFRRPRHQRDRSAWWRSWAPDHPDRAASRATSRSPSRSTRKAHPKKDVHQRHRRRRSTRPWIVRAPNFFRWNGDGAPGGTPATGWVAYKRARLAQGRRDHGRLLVRLDVGRRVHRRVSARLGGEVTKRVFPAAEHDRLLVPTWLSSIRPTRSTATSGRSAARGTIAALKAFEQKYGNMKLQAAHGQPVSSGRPARFTEPRVCASPARTRAAAARLADVPVRVP